MNNRDILINQIKLQEQIQKAGFNIVTCGNCGETLIHNRGDETIKCFCGNEMSLTDCPDLYYKGMNIN